MTGVILPIGAELRVTGVLGLAPWTPDRVSVEPLRGKRLRAPWGTPVPLPRARRWLELISAEVERFARNGGGARVSQ